MGRETVAEKAARYLVEGRLRVEFANRRGQISARCVGGEGRVYSLGFEPFHDAGWFCSCAARGDCSHLQALRLVTVEPPTSSSVVGRS